MHQKIAVVLHHSVHTMHPTIVNLLNLMAMILQRGYAMPDAQTSKYGFPR